MSCQLCSTKELPEKPFSICSRCRYAKYCSADCQKKDWPAHKLVCRSLAHLPKPGPSQDTVLNHYKAWQISKRNTLISFAYSVLSHQTETTTMVLECNHVDNAPYFIFEESSLLPIDDLPMISMDVYREIQLCKKSHVLTTGKKLMFVIVIVDNVTPKITRICPLEFQVDSPEFKDAGMLTPDLYKMALNTP